eukprot:TRINITY_DN9599_c0_g2_i2.p1 TRINITY_DN9599_c0_g2~~TRINITY_DN9599_c0_g2_i2.p1  ORF type:complete len:150 (-),score=8.55 TRINITY_DN9599_c0_g2_i2:34-483(-)
MNALQKSKKSYECFQKCQEKCSSKAYDYDLWHGCYLSCQDCVPFVGDKSQKALELCSLMNKICKTAASITNNPNTRIANLCNSRSQKLEECRELAMKNIFCYENVVNRCLNILQRGPYPSNIYDCYRKTEQCVEAVSYTHLTLPTIYSV